MQRVLNRTLLTIFCLLFLLSSVTAVSVVNDVRLPLQTLGGQSVGEAALQLTLNQLYPSTQNGQTIVFYQFLVNTSSYTTNFDDAKLYYQLRVPKGSILPFESETIFNIGNTSKGTFKIAQLPAFAVSFKAKELVAIVNVAGVGHKNGVAIEIDSKVNVSFILPPPPATVAGTISFSKTTGAGDEIKEVTLERGQFITLDSAVAAEGKLEEFLINCDSSIIDVTCPAATNLRGEFTMRLTALGTASPGTYQVTVHAQGQFLNITTRLPVSIVVNGVAGRAIFQEGTQGTAKIFWVLVGGLVVIALIAYIAIHLERKKKLPPFPPLLN